ncbi:hypothetical protein TgHK011_002035 [Trichoderma gracile]|nr:hypothetical protein TgHK011_002035 [Trichoderma gracile]
MPLSKTCFALASLWLATTFPSAGAAAPSGGSWSPVSFSFSASVTTEPSSTTTTRGSLTDEADISQHTSRAKSSRSCPNVFCLPISPWTKTEAHQTSTSASSTHSSSSTASSTFVTSTTSPSACLQQISPSKTLSPMRFNFTDACDADTAAAEDCRVTLSCDTSLGLFPTCDRGQCECLSKECFRKSMCEDLRQCRDYDEAVCIRDDPTDVGSSYTVIVIKMSFGGDNNDQYGSRRSDRDTFGSGGDSFGSGGDTYGSGESYGAGTRRNEEASFGTSGQGEAFGSGNEQYTSGNTYGAGNEQYGSGNTFGSGTDTYGSGNRNQEFSSGTYRRQDEPYGSSDTYRSSGQGDTYGSGNRGETYGSSGNQSSGLGSSGGSNERSGKGENLFEKVKDKVTHMGGRHGGDNH